MGKKQSMSVRLDGDLVDDVDKRIAQLVGDGDLPPGYTRSDLVRDLFHEVADDPQTLSDLVDGREAEA